MKRVRIVSIIMGSLYAFGGIVGILSLRFLNVVSSEFQSEPDPVFNKMIELMSTAVEIFLPLLLILGLTYIVFGVFFEKLVNIRLYLSILLAVLSIAMIVFYLAGLQDYFSYFNDIITDESVPSFFQSYTQFVSIISSVLSFAFFCAPQLIIAKLTYDENKKTGIS